MKKYFYLAAVSAMMLTACSSDKDVLQPTPEPSTPTVAAQQQAVAFDTYLAGTTASTRAGETGVMTTGTLQTTGFGVFASLSNDGDYASTTGPNFMYNQQVTYAAPGWAYTPLKYWPNETTADMYNATGHATSTATDKLSFFAYAPYVSSTTGSYGITAMSTNAATTDPTVTWTYSKNPDENVDLLWGVAPAGFSYTNVSGTTTSVPVGMPLLNLVKPDKDQKIKFLFQHALSRISLSVVSAIDQIAAGDDAGTFTSDPTTKVLIKSVTVSGSLGQTGTLNLNNTTKGSNKANWTVSGTSTTFDITGAPSDFTTPVATNNYFLAPDLRYVESQISAVGTTAANFAAVNAGVLPSEQALLAGDKDDSKKVTNPAFAYGKVYYTSAGASDLGYVIAKTTGTNDADLYTKDEKGNYTQAFKSTDTSISLDGNSPKYYKITEGSVVASGTVLTNDIVYYHKTGSAGSFKYTKVTGDGIATSDGAYYSGFAEGALLSGSNYSGTCYSGLIPRYFMVIPTGATNISVNIVYAVVTKDENLNNNVSNVENNITKTVNVDLKNGKSYNLKLVLGLTSVKLDATVADWKVDGSNEVDLPQNAQ